jgi:hypothetical protein
MSTVDGRAPYTQAAAVTPHDTNPLPIGLPVKALWVGGAGSLIVRMARAQNTVTIAAVPAGTLLPIEVDLVKTGGTASSILALG